ncbi:MAG: 50S ribosomal protein L23 [Candidatus Pacebacteria bacterium]|nr:50S ribosomal protein L23 [Candidatus Paceibacterota bacterium]
MALFNLGKKSDKGKERQEIKRVDKSKIKTQKAALKSKKEEEIKANNQPQVLEPPTVKAPPKHKKEVKIAPSVLKHPHITEKATKLGENNQYIFKVFDRANKSEVKKAVEEVYSVNVVDVKIINIPAKKRRLGRTEGYKAGYKKAIVKIKKDQTIEIMPR